MGNPEWNRFSRLISGPLPPAVRSSVKATPNYLTDQYAFSAWMIEFSVFVPGSPATHTGYSNKAMWCHQYRIISWNHTLPFCSTYPVIGSNWTVWDGFGVWTCSAHLPKLIAPRWVQLLWYRPDLFLPPRDAQPPGSLKKIIQPSFIFINTWVESVPLCSQLSLGIAPDR